MKKMMNQQRLEAVERERERERERGSLYTTRKSSTQQQGNLIEKKRVAEATLKVMEEIDFYLVCKEAY